jgi:hypothetical protein
VAPVTSARVELNRVTGPMLVAAKRCRTRTMPTTRSPRTGTPALSKKLRSHAGAPLVAARATGGRFA